MGESQGHHIQVKGGRGKLHHKILDLTYPSGLGNSQQRGHWHRHLLGGLSAVYENAPYMGRTFLLYLQEPFSLQAEMKGV